MLGLLYSIDAIKLSSLIVARAMREAACRRIDHQIRIDTNLCGSGR
jgi:hypothetical protein